MAIIDVEILDESQQRYLTYALSVVSGRALPDVRDGLKPVHRRILFAMHNNLRLSPDKAHRKSAAVVGEVLARYHPHGDTACYDALVRMAQDFSLRYPLIDGQGNFGSLDGDSAAAYRYTEARLTPIALEVIGEIDEETVESRDNFDQTVKEPVVLPSRVPNLLINGSSGIAVGLATSIPPHNLKEIVKALLVLIKEPDAIDSKVYASVKGPDFPTGCHILNTRKEITEIYKTGKGAIRMRAGYEVEHKGRGKYQIVINSIPYGLDKSVLIEKIADLIIARKVPQLVDIRDESTDVVRIVLELAPNADAEQAMAYLYKNTTLESNFNMNLTAIVPTDNPYAGKPELLSLRSALQYFVDFRLEVTKRKLTYEKNKLEARIHLLEGLVLIFPDIQEVIKLIQKSDGRSSAAEALQKKFKLSEVQAFFIVDLRLYQLSKTSIEDIKKEFKEKTERVKAINAILKSKKALDKEVATDLERVANEYGDARRCEVISEFEEIELDVDDYVQHEDAHVIVTKDGWMKRIRANNDPSSTRIREGDEFLFVQQASTADYIAIFSSAGNVYVTRVMNVVSTSGYGDPVQKTFKFKDGEQVVDCLIVDSEHKDDAKEILLFSEDGYGLRLPMSMIEETKKNGKRLMKIGSSDKMSKVLILEKDIVVSVSEQGYGICFHKSDIPLLSGPGKGVIMQKVPGGDKVRAAFSVGKKQKVKVVADKGLKEVDVSAMSITGRAKRGNKVVKRGLPVIGPVIEVDGGSK